ncbi:hypothetical protein KBY75_03410 [Cyanobium sp. T1G-Tous]|uniref:glycosyltransferase n=1 Tax=Cyanobium sp. T1G-Tous TaxID=2823722 RepID=UPI0020CE260C|nr:hypothetical protein [Cyanobium sp. T1G-Tous]MCP9802612.1 hypothetical protein [Cyanobium sp. T1G-Tous]
MTRRIQLYPVVQSFEQLRDLIARAAWHFSYLEDAQLFVPLAPGIGAPSDIKIPRKFDPQVQNVLDSYLPKVRFQLNTSASEAYKLLEVADVVLKFIEGDSDVEQAIKLCKKRTFRVDSEKVRQEGSFYIQCAHELLYTKAELINDCHNKFQALMQRLGRRPAAWLIATGPSVESYANHDYDDAIVIACNSVILNQDLMDYCKPSILVFADPIFHFGVSEYAGMFRSSVKSQLEKTSIIIVVPFKYYPLLLSCFPEHKNRIIGIPFDALLHHNLDLGKNFLVKVTANILTLLLLPLATTFSRRINLIGCDGRPLENDEYFWGHGNSVQINDKMSNIKEVHPGFFAIDYNEYYYEHCNTLANLLEQGEDAGYRFAHHGPSHIPALRDRPAEYLSEPLIQARSKAAQRRAGNARACVVIEPDGVGMSGHYVRWHNNLIAELKHKFERVDVLCNCKQDASLYSCPARPTFTCFSWSISRADYCFCRDFPDSQQFVAFVNELLGGIKAQHDPLPSELSLYVYYGSVQILKALQLVRRELLREGCSLKSFVCLFHESVILDLSRTEPRFPPNAAEILSESVAQVDSYRIASVTDKLSDLVFAKFGVATTVFPNPAPSLSDSVNTSLLQKSIVKGKNKKEDQLASVLLLGNPRDEKGGQICNELLEHLRHFGVPAGQRFLFRGAPPSGTPPILGVEFLGEEIDDKTYWHLLSTSDVAILPYLAPAFTYRTSGILADALISTLPVIVIGDTWLADVVRRTGSGLVVNYFSPLTLISAVKVLLANYDIVQRRISKGAPAYFAENTWSATADLSML